MLGFLDHAEVLRPDDVRSAVIARLEALSSSPVGEASTKGRRRYDCQLDTVGTRLRRLLAILTWLAQEGEAPIDEVAARFDLTPGALVAELEMAACCGVPPYTPDQLHSEDLVVTEDTVSAHLGETSLARGHAG